METTFVVYGREGGRGKDGNQIIRFGLNWNRFNGGEFIAASSPDGSTQTALRLPPEAQN